MFEHIPHEDTATFISPMPTQLVFGHVTLLNDQETFLQGMDSGIETVEEYYDQPQQMTAQALLNDFLETLSGSDDIPLAWRVGLILGRMIGLLHPDLEQESCSTYLEALEQHCQRRTC